MGGRPHRLLVCSFLLWQLSGIGTTAFADKPVSVSPPPSRCRTILTKTSKTMMAVTAGLMLVLGPGATGFHDVRAGLEGKQHIGHGIYFDPESFITALGADSDALRKQAQEDPLAVVRMLNDVLSGDYDSDSATVIPPLFPRARDATEFLRGNADRRGVCRHKAIVLAAILNHLGIRATLEIGYTQSGTLHEFVFIVGHGLIADPTDNVLQDAASFRAEQIRYNVPVLPRMRFGGVY